MSDPATMKVLQLDADGLRVLAHPLRMRLVGSLRLDGSATASGLAQRLGVSSGLTSYHLRALADAGIVEDDPDHPAKGRERWWRAAHDMTSWRADAGDPASEEWLAGYSARRAMTWIDGWLQRRADEPPEWQAVSGTSDYVVAVTPDELQGLLDDVTELVRPYLRLSGEPTEGREEVRLLLQSFLRGDDG